jgi:single-stranded-DNA-specific exonuclease
VEYVLKGDNDYLFDIHETIFKNRGIDDYSQFLNLDKKVEIPYKKLKNIDKAVSCVTGHIEEGNKIALIVDPDTDGFTSAATLYQYLKLIDEEVSITYLLHDDKKHGFEGIEIPEGTDLIITPDSGSEDVEYHKKYKDMGIDIVVLDHHELTEESKDAIVVNPQLGGYSNLNLSGVGIVYKFCQALDDFYWTNYADNFLDLVALGNIADSMCMKELETRYYVDKGLKDVSNELFRALLRHQEYSTNGKINITTLSFYISPMINAVIRVGKMEDKIDLFRALIGEKALFKYKPRGSEEEIQVSLIDDMPRRCANIRGRQGRLVSKIVEEVMNKVENEKLDNNKVIIVHNIQTIEEWVTGLIAIKIAEKYKKPTIILSTKNKDGVYKGSARGYEKSELKDFKTVVEETDVFELAKGHPNAFGVRIKESNIPKAIARFNEVLDHYSFEDKYEVDLSVPANSMSEYIINKICELEHVWGKNIPEPYLLINNLDIESSMINLVGKKEDTVSIYNNGISYMLFKVDKSVYDEIMAAKSITIIGKANINEYKDKKTPQIFIEKYQLKY